MLCEKHYLISAFFPRLGNFCALTREIFIPSKGTKTATGAWMEKYLHQRWLKQGAPNICDRCDSSKTGGAHFKITSMYILIYT